MYLTGSRVVSYRDVRDLVDVRRASQFESAESLVDHSPRRGAGLDRRAAVERRREPGHERVSPAEVEPAVLGVRRVPARQRARIAVRIEVEFRRL